MKESEKLLRDLGWALWDTACQNATLQDSGGPGSDGGAGRIERLGLVMDLAGRRGIPETTTVAAMRAIGKDGFGR